jgi:predicted amidohydrolase
MQDLKVTLIQTDLYWENIENNLSLFENRFSFIDEPTDLIILPEMFNTAFTMKSVELAEEMNGKSMQWMAFHAKEKKAVITGSLIIKENGSYYNRLIWMRPDGSYEYYDKRHLFRMANEHEHYSSGNKKIVVELKGWKICPLICYDLRFPVWSRNKLEYDVLLYIANWPERRRIPWITLLAARAIENYAYTIGINRIGNDGNNISFSGDTSVYDFWGSCLSHFKPHEKKIETIILSYEKLQEFKKSFPVWMDSDKFEIIT